MSSPTDDGAGDSVPPPEDNWGTVVPDPSPIPSTPEQTRTWAQPTDSTWTAPGAVQPALPGLPEGVRDHPRYRVVREIGGGGMGTVYLAEHKLMGRTVALKTIQLRLAGDPALVERFLREVRASAKLNHENVVGVYDAEQTPDALFLVMEYLAGEDLLTLEESGQQAVVPLDELCPELPPEAGSLIARMTARRQEDRFQSCAEVMAALEPLCRVKPGDAADRGGV
jgi:Protein kinase domain